MNNKQFCTEQCDGDCMTTQSSTLKTEKRDPFNFKSYKNDMS